MPPIGEVAGCKPYLKQKFGSGKQAIADITLN